MSKPVTSLVLFGSLSTAKSTDLDANLAALQGAINDPGIAGNYSADTGAANAYVMTLTGYSLTAYANGQHYQFIPANTNSGASTLNVNGLGAVSIKRWNGSALQAGDITAGYLVDCWYNATQGVFQLMGTYVATGAAGSGLITQNVQGGNYTLAASDTASSIYLNGAGPQTVNVPVNSSVSIPVGTITSIDNVGGAAASIVPAGGVTLYLPGTGTGTRTLATPGTCTLRKTNTNEWFISGAGLT